MRLEISTRIGNITEFKEMNMTIVGAEHIVEVPVGLLRLRFC